MAHPRLRKIGLKEWATERKRMRVSCSGRGRRGTDRGLVAAMPASWDFKGIRRKRLPIFMLGADHAFQDPMGRWIATGTLAE